MADPVAVGLDLGGSSVKFGLVSRAGRLVARGTVGLGGDAAAVWRAIEAAFARSVELARDHGVAIAAVGLGTPGTVHDGVVVGFSPNLPGWAGQRVEEHLRKITGLPSAADNDANVAALAEARVGAGRGVDDFVLVTVGTGVGGGVVLGGRVHRGECGAAGEIGHTVLVRGGRLCGCGRRGCVEAYANVAALIRAARREMKKRPHGVLAQLARKRGTLDVRVVDEASRRSDPSAFAALDGVAGALASGLLSVVHLIAPRRVVLGGGVSEVSGFVGRVRRSLMPQVVPLARAGLSVVKAKLGNAAGTVGAGLLAFESARWPE